MKLEPKTVAPSPEVLARLTPALDAMMAALGEYTADVMADVDSVPMGQRTAMTLQLSLGICAVAQHTRDAYDIEQGEARKHFEGVVHGFVGGILLFIDSMPPRLKEAFVANVIGALVEVTARIEEPAP